MPPQEIAVGTEEAAGSQAQATAGYAPWASVEDKEEDVADMGRLLERRKARRRMWQLLSATCVTGVTGR